MTAPTSETTRRPRRSVTGAPGYGVREQLKVWSPSGLPAVVRGAYLATRNETGDRSVSDLVNRAIERELRRLAKAHHDGEPFEPAGPGIVPTGRPVGS